MNNSRILFIALVLTVLLRTGGGEQLGLPSATNGSNQNRSVDLGEVLGPVVIGKDGSTTRIANWPNMTADEKERTRRVIGARNRKRVAALRARGKDIRLDNSKEEL